MIDTYNKVIKNTKNGIIKLIQIILYDIIKII